MPARPVSRLIRLFVILLTLCTIGAAHARDWWNWRQHEAVTIAAESLPPEARETLALIHQGGPFPYRKDGITFQNRERRLPESPSGYYREYTVITPGSGDRGARRIITGGRPPEVIYYSDDHYRSFKRIKE